MVGLTLRNMAKKRHANLRTRNFAIKIKIILLKPYLLRIRQNLGIRNHSNFSSAWRNRLCARSKVQCTRGEGDPAVWGQDRLPRESVWLSLFSCKKNYSTHTVFSKKRDLVKGFTADFWLAEVDCWRWRCLEKKELRRRIARKGVQARHSRAACVASNNLSFKCGRKKKRGSTHRHASGESGENRSRRWYPLAWFFQAKN